MKRAIGVLVAHLLTGSYVWSQSGPMAPPTRTQQAPPTHEPAPSDSRSFPVKEVEGNITSMDVSRTTITIDDGTQLIIPDSLRAARDVLKEGARVKASYEEQAGQKFVTSIKVQIKP